MKTYSLQLFANIFLIVVQGYLQLNRITQNRRAYFNSAIFQNDCDDDMILRKVDKWACIKNCGACCKLGPLDSRPDLAEYLTPVEFEKYSSMIGEDNWCVHFDQINRLCTVYEDRPEFCKVDAKKYEEMFEIEEDELNEFCAFCCREQISDVYGEKSIEMDRFESVLEKIQ
eukprot:gene8533-11533_t